MFRKGHSGYEDLAARTWWRRLLSPLALMLTAFALQLLAGLAPRFVEEYYSRRLFPLVPRLLSFSGIASFSLAETLLASVSAAVAVWLTSVVVRLCKRRREALAILLDALTKLLRAVGIIYVLFMFVFGLNYQRQPLAENLQFERRDPTPPEIVTISRTVIEGINGNYAESGAAPDGERGSRMPLTAGELYRVLESAYEADPLLRDAPTVGVPPKPVHFSGVMSRLGVAGFYSPFTGEVNYDTLPPDCDLPFSVAHEMAHQRGFAREDEANFIAFLVCTHSSNAYVRYSGYLGALRVLGILIRVAPDRYRETVAALGEGPRADLKARAQFWARYSGRLSNFGQSINHVYLRVNGVRSGIRNYNEASALIVGYYLKQAAAQTPPRRLNVALDYTIFYACPRAKNTRRQTQPHAFSNATA